MTTVEPLPDPEPPLPFSLSVIPVTREHPDERYLAAALERTCRDRVASLEDELGVDVSHDLLAARFDITVAALRNLLWTHDWPIQCALRVAFALELVNIHSVITLLLTDPDPDIEPLPDLAPAPTPPSPPSRLRCRHCGGATTATAKGEVYCPTCKRFLSKARASVPPATEPEKHQPPCERCSGPTFWSDTHGAWHCATCEHDMFAPRCVVCSFPGSWDLDRARWHCYSCDRDFAPDEGRTRVTGPVLPPTCGVCGSSMSCSS